MTRTSKRLTAGIFIAVVLGLGVLSLRSFVDYRASQKLGVLDGELARSVEDHYDDGFPARDLGTNVWAAINYVVFHEGRQGVTVGKDDWLFTDEELYLGTEHEQIVDTNIERVLRVRRYLQSRGIPMVVLVVPTKASLYPDKLGDHQPVGAMQHLYSRFLHRLTAAGVAAPRLQDVLAKARDQGTQVFLRTDTHWSPAGADVFARYASGYIQRRFQDQDWGQQRFVTTLGQPKEHQGDLLNYIPLDPLFEDIGPTPDRFRTRQTSPASSETPTSTQLFSEQETDLVLVGTSYSANPLWDFAGALRRYLGKDLINVSEEGHGPFMPMTAYLQSGEFQSHPPGLIVWEFPERYLGQPIESKETLAWFKQDRAQLVSASTRNQTISEEN